LCPPHPKQTRTIRNSWLTESTCFAAASTRPPTPLSASALLQMHLTRPYPSSQLRLSASGMRGDLYDNWSAAGLSTSDDAELRAITDGVCQAYNVGLEDVQQVHIFSNSANALRLTMDMSHHSGQHVSLSICKVLVPWLRHHPNNCVHFHHITPGVELEDHQLAHILATSTRIEEGGALVISADFARRRAVTRMLEGLELTVPVQKVYWIKLPDSVSEEGYPFCPNPR
jgi:hypothetical protein